MRCQNFQFNRPCQALAVLDETWHVAALTEFQYVHRPRRMSHLPFAVPVAICRAPHTALTVAGQSFDVFFRPNKKAL